MMKIYGAFSALIIWIIALIVWSIVWLIFSSQPAASSQLIQLRATNIELRVGSLPSISITGIPETFVALTTDEDLDVMQIVAESVFSTTNLWVNSSAFTGYPSINNLGVSAAAGVGVFYYPRSDANNLSASRLPQESLSGEMGLTGGSVIVAGGYVFTIPLFPIGRNDASTVVASVLNNDITLQADGFTAGRVAITGIETQVISMPGRGGGPADPRLGVPITADLSAFERMTIRPIADASGNPWIADRVTVNGFVNISQSPGGDFNGAIRLVSPFRLLTGKLTENMPGVIIMDLEIIPVPEPGLMLLLVSGAIGLVLIGRGKR